MADYINKHIKPDVILWTGDSTPHTEYLAIDLEEKKEYMTWINTFLRTNFSTTPLYPILGNHDYAVSNM